MFIFTLSLFQKQSYLCSEMNTPYSRFNSVEMFKYEKRDIYSDIYWNKKSLATQNLVGILFIIKIPVL